MNKSRLLAIETSCDETAAAVVKDGRKVLSNVTLSQIEIHEKFGGVIPEVAARQHLEVINHVIEKALEEADVQPHLLDGVACTFGPGLIGSLLTGIAAAKAFSFAVGLPLYQVDHLEAHICANYLESNLEPPFLCLLVSGGHTQIIQVEKYGSYKLIGQTKDDAAGEAFDKVSRMLSLGYPGGPAIELSAQTGDSKAFKFPRAKMKDFDFSFSGLKTAVLRQLELISQPWPVSDLAASFQDTITSTLVDVLMSAQSRLNAPVICLAGGVAANLDLRKKLIAACQVPVVVPAVKYCTDNAAMVASAAYFSQPEDQKSASAMAYSRSKL